MTFFLLWNWTTRYLLDQCSLFSYLFLKQSPWSASFFVCSKISSRTLFHKAIRNRGCYPCLRRGIHAGSSGWSSDLSSETSRPIPRGWQLEMSRQIMEWPLYTWWFHINLSMDEAPKSITSPSTCVLIFADKLMNLKFCCFYNVIIAEVIHFLSFFIKWFLFLEIILLHSPQENIGIDQNISVALTCFFVSELGLIYFFQKPIFWMPNYISICRHCLKN